MNKIPYYVALVVAISLSSFVCNAQNTIIENVDAQTFKTLVDTGSGIILDVRTIEEVQRGHIPNSSNLDIYQADFETKLDRMQKDKPIYVYCRSGARSSKAAATMESLGFTKVYNLLGGTGAWKQAGYGLEESENTNSTAKPVSLADFNTLLDTDKTVLVKFGTQWCAPCKKMIPIVNDFEKANEDIVVLHIDPDVSKEVAQNYNIITIPAFLVFKDGKETARQIGMMTQDELLDLTNRHLSN